MDKMLPYVAVIKLISHIFYSHEGLVIKAYFLENVQSKKYEELKKLT